MALPIIYPMKAKSIVDCTGDTEHLWEDDNGWVAERKYDGARYLLYVTNDGPNRLFSRRPSDKKGDGTPVEKTDNVPHLRDTKFKGFGLTILDGEVITSLTASSSDVVKIMGASPEKAVARQKEQGRVMYVVFDILYLDGDSCMSLPWAARRMLLEQWLAKQDPDNMEGIYLSDYTPVNKRQYYEDILASGGEGVVLKNVTATYEPDKRPVNNWVKVKKYETFDVVITGFDPPEVAYKGKTSLDEWPYWLAFDAVSGKWCPVEPGKMVALKGAHIKPVTKLAYHDWIGAIRFGQYVCKDTTAQCSDGCDDYPEECECCGGVSCELTEIGTTSGMDDATRAAISAGPDAYIGRVIEVGAMERIKKTGALRHPRFLRFRDDKLPQECIMGEC